MKAHIYKWRGSWRADSEFKFFGLFAVSGCGKTPSKAYRNMKKNFAKIGQHRPAK